MCSVYIRFKQEQVSSVNYFRPCSSLLKRIENRELQKSDQITLPVSCRHSLLLGLMILGSRKRNPSELAQRVRWKVNCLGGQWLAFCYWCSWERARGIKTNKVIVAKEVGEPRNLVLSLSSLWKVFECLDAGRGLPGDPSPEKQRVHEVGREEAGSKLERRHGHW